MLRREVEPVEQVAYARFLAEWQGVGSPARGYRRGAVDARAARRLRDAGQRGGVGDPARPGSPTTARRCSTSSPPPARCFWVGDGPIGESDGWVRCYLPGTRSRTPPTSNRRPGADRSCWRRSAGVAPTSSMPCCRPGWRVSDRSDYVTALWELVWAGLVSSDTFAPVRARVSGGAHRQARRPAARTHRARLAGGRPGPAGPDAARRRSPTTAGPVVAGGPRRGQPPAARLAGDVFAQLDRYGVVTRGSVLTESSEGGFGAAYRALSSLEESGQCRRGYFVSGLGAAQFALTGAVDRLRAAAAGAGATAGPGAGGLRPGQPVRGGSALARAGRTPAGPQGRALWSCWWTGRWCSTSSAAAGRCSPSPRTRSGWRRRRTHLPAPSGWASWAS